MRFIIADPALTENTGHHPNSCRYIADAARARGMTVEIYGNLQMDRTVQDELGAVPHFLAYTYLHSDGDPFCGWLSTYITVKDVTRSDLARLGKVVRDDVVLVHGARAAQMAAAFEWAAGFPEDECPLIVIELGGSPGVEVKDGAAGARTVEPPNPNITPEPALCRFAVQWAPALGRRPVHVITCRPETSAVYQLIMRKEIGALPFPVPSITAPCNRAGKRPVTIATLGHQQAVKGYHLMPDVIAGLLEVEPEVRFLVHNSDPDQVHAIAAGPMKDAGCRLEAMAAADPRIVLENRAVTFEEWVALIAGCDLIVCPYSPTHYAAGHSGLASAAVANGIPVVVPARTTLSRYLEDFGDIGATIAGFDAASVIAATRAVLRRFDFHADAAFAAAKKWAEREGPGGFVDGALALRNKPSPFMDAATPVNVLTARALKTKGDEYLKAGAFAAARASYEAAIAQVPDFAPAYCNLGIALREMGDLAGAETVLRRAHELDPRRVNVLTNLGSILSALGRSDDAISFLRRAIAAAPENTWFKSNLASALAAANRPAEAAAELEAAVRDLPQEPLLWCNLGDAYRAAGNAAAAVAAYEQAAVLRSDYPGLQDKIRQARESGR